MTAAPPDPIAIDGPAASGKSTIGRTLASRFDYSFLDTGLMYRAFTLAAMRAGVPPEERPCEELAGSLAMRLGDEQEARVYLGEEDVTDLLHNPDIEQNVSAYARLAPVRAAMRAQQREFARRGKTVLAGRDIGEVVLPDAPAKFYLDANEEARARRRNAERRIVEEARARDAQAALARRDELDSPQTYIAPGAIVIDTSHMTLDEVMAAVLEELKCSRS